MKPVKQTLFGGVDDEIKGNCFQAVLASLLELPLDEVPHFCQLCSDEDYWTEISRWLMPRGYLYMCIEQIIVDKYAPFLLQTGHYYIVSGDGPRGHKHNCIACKGKIVFDPHPSNDGLVTIDNYEFLLKWPPGLRAEADKRL